MDIIHKMLDDIRLPRMFAVKQRFEDRAVSDLAALIDTQFARGSIRGQIKPGMRIGITVGSRGIANLCKIVAHLCRNLRALQAQPVILPSMGSHGNAEAAGQVKVLAELGITEEAVGAPILAGMEVVSLGVCALGFPVYYDEIALSLDGVIVLNRVKAHTDLVGDIESGLHKMIAVGLGNHAGAVEIHAKGIEAASERVKAAANLALQKGNILFGVAIRENAYDHTYDITFVERERIALEEPRLLLESRSMLPRILLNDIDVLIVDQLGKNISGDGMDPNVIGRGMVGIKNPDIRINKIICLGLTPQTKSNALGIGLADITTRQVLDRMEFDAMYTNSVTALVTAGARIPIVMDNDRLALQLALKLCYLEDTRAARVVRIRDTLSLGEIMVSEAYRADVDAAKDLEQASQLAEIAFDAGNNMRSSPVAVH